MLMNCGSCSIEAKISKFLDNVLISTLRIGYINQNFMVFFGLFISLKENIS